MKNEKMISLLPIETERLVLRPTSTKDVDMLLKMDQQEVTQLFLGGIKNKTREERIAFLEKKASKYQEGIAGSLTVCLKDGTPIGLTGLNIDEKNNSATIGYIFDYDYCNQGYCTEACRELLKIGFKRLDLNRISADTIDGNNSSKRVLEKLNFKLEGRRRKAAKIKDDYKDFLDYGILKEEYKE